MAEINTKNTYLEPFVPDLILNWYRTAFSDEIHTVSEHEGILCFADVSGFTRLTRRLADSGNEGPEILTGILNRYFSLIADEIYGRNGDILKFAGDAVWAYFPDLVDLHGIIRTITDNLSRLGKEFPVIAANPLSVHIGAEWGKFRMVSLGHPGLRLEPEPFGEIVAVTMRSADSARPGEIVIGPGLAEKGLKSFDLTPHSGNLFLINGTSNTIPVRNRTTLQDDMAIPENALEPYISRNLLSRLKSSAQHRTVQDEYRRVTVLFANFEGIKSRSDSSEDYTSLNDTVIEAFKIIHSHGGSIARIDPYQTGHKLLVLFGAPVRTGDDELQAAHAALQLVRLANQKFRIRVGMAQGTLYCGEVGTSKRKEYTIMGDTANLAVRLMGAADWGWVLFDKSLKESLPPDIITREQPLRLKGYETETIAFRLTGISEKADETLSVIPLIARKKEIEELENSLRETENGVCRIVVLKGESGLGKSALLADFCKNHCAGNAIRLNCRNAVLFGHAWLAGKLVSELYEKNREAKRVPLIRFVRERIDSDWWPLLAEIIGVASEDNDWTRGLTPELRRTKTSELFLALFASLIEDSTIIAIDDFDRADEFSRNLIASLYSAEFSRPLLLILTTSGEIDHAGQDTVKYLPLRSPSDSEWKSLFATRFSDGKRERELIRDLLNRSGGNPGFVAEFIAKGISEKVFVTNRLTDRLELNADSAVPTVPARIEDLLLARFDALPESERTLLKAASVIGSEFTLEVLATILPDFGNIDSTLNSLIEKGILRGNRAGNGVDFVHGTMRDAVYSCIPHSTLQQWHGALAERMESSGITDSPELLARHFHRARNWQKAFRYHIEAAEKSLASYSLNSAYEIFNYCRAILDRKIPDQIPPGLIYRYHAKYSELLMLDGKFKEIYPVYRNWRNDAITENNCPEYFSAAIKTGALMWKQSRYRHCRRVFASILASPSLSDYPAHKARLLSAMGELERRAGNFTTAQEHCHLAADIAEQCGDFQLIADIYNNLGLALWGEGKLEEAAECYRRCLVTARKYGKYTLAQTSNNLAIIYWEQGDFISADKMLTEAHQIFRNIGDRRNEAYSAGNLSSIHRISGKLNSARNLLLRAGQVFEKLGDRHAGHYVAGNIGDIDLIEGRVSEAQEKYSSAKAFAEEVGDRELLAECEVRFGDLAFFRFELDKAESLYHKALEAANEIGSVEYALRARIGLARLYIRNRRTDEAFAIVNEIRETAQINNSIIIAHEAEFLLGEQARIAENNFEAIEHYNRVLKYARAQNVFELTLKCAIRIYELSDENRQIARQTLSELVEYLAEFNGPDCWKTLVNSAYFAHFAESLMTLDFSG